MFYSAAVVSSSYWAAEATGESTGSTIADALLKGGPFAIVLALIILDKLGTNSERDRLRTENQSLRDLNQTLNDSIREEIVAPMSEQNRLMAEVVRLLDDEDRFPRRRAPRNRST